MREPHGELEGRTAIVTGAANGIGLAIAKRYAAERANVVIADIDEGAGGQAVEQITAAGGTAVFVPCDVGSNQDVDTTVDTAVDRFGGVDILVNNAGDVVTSRHFLDGDEKWWDDMIRVNLKGHFLFIKRVAPLMVQAHHGVIINMSSGGANRSHRGAVGYDASKGAIEAMTRSLALELGPYGIRVNALVPGLIASRPEHLLDGAKERRDATIPLGRGGYPEDLAGPAVFLASQDAEYVTGHCLVVDGAVLVQQRPPQIETFGLDKYPRIPGSLLS
jgi:3-oxoacyl-[acyl-carrier protein] reductase